VQTRSIRTLGPAGGGRSAISMLRLVAVCGLLGTLLLYLSTFLHHPAKYSLMDDGLLGNLPLIASAAVCLGRAALVRLQRTAYLLLGLAATGFTGGNLVYVFHVQFLDPLPYPSLADVGYLSTYPLLLSAIAVLAYPELRALSRSALLDGALGALSCAAVGSVLVVEPALGSLQGSVLAHVVGAAYPVLDLTLVAVIVGIVTLKGGRPDATWLWLAAGVVTFAVADTVYLHRVAHNSYTVGTGLDALWAVGLTLIAVAATLPYRQTPRRTEQARNGLWVPNIFSVFGIVILVYGSVTSDRLPIYAVILTLATLLTAVQRTAVGVSALRLLAVSQREARTDELTQLSNRRHFDEQAQRILADRGPGERLAMVMVDLDEFKAINDTFGHHAGDELLRQIGPRLHGQLRPGDLLARLGGDEFALLLRDCDRATALVVAQRMVAAIAEPFLIEGETQSAAASIGIALCPEDGVDMAVLLQRADAAMFDAKSHSGGVATYDTVKHGDHERLSARDALEGHELVVVYQPQYDLANGRMIGVEALVRWKHPVRGLLYPDAFLSFFEQAGLMAELTLEVLEIGVRDRRRWQAGGTSLSLSINLAPSALLRGDLIESISRLLGEHGMPPAELTLEITENAMMLDIERSRRALADLHALGIRLSLDDYGTGYCSLTYLRDLPVHEIKIDRSFVMTLVPDSVDAAIITSSIQLARRLGLRTVGEGVENSSGLNVLRELGCDVVQGYLLARPVPAEEVLKLPRPDWAQLTGLTGVLQGLEVLANNRRR
jgi:diguanylate cyclase (GGDEF)-like protein